MARPPGIRFTIFALGLLLFVLAWRLQVSKPAPSSPRTASAQASAAKIGGGERRDLAWDEQQGGHTLERHVGRSESELAERLTVEAGIAAASTFRDRETAEAVVGRALAREQERVASWMQRGRENLTIHYRGSGDQTIGWILLRGKPQPMAASDARVVLRKRGGRYFVLTSYPVEP